MTPIDGIGRTTATSSPSGSSTVSSAGISSAQAAVSSAEQRVSTAQQGISTLQSAYTSLQGQVAPARVQFTQAQASYHQLQAQLRTERADVTTAQSGVTTARSAVTSARSDVSGAKGDVREAIAAQRKAQGDVRSADRELRDARSATREATADQKSASEKLRTADRAVDQAQDKVRATGSAVDRAEGGLRRAQGAVRTAEGRVKAADGRVAAADREVRSAQSALASAQARLRRNPKDAAAQAAVRSAQARLNGAKGRLASARSEASAARSGLQQARQAERQAQQALEQARREAQEAKRRLQEAKQRQQEARRALEQAKAAVAKAKEAEARAKQAVEKAKEGAEKAKAQLEKAKQQLEKAEQALEKAQAKLEQATEKLTKAKSDVERVQDKLDAARARMEAARTKADEARRKADDKKSQLAEAKGRLADAKSGLAAARTRLTEARRDAQRAREQQQREAEQKRAQQRQRELDAQRARAKARPSSPTGAVAGARGGAVAGDRNGDGKLSAAEEIQLLKSHQARARAEQARLAKERVQASNIDARMTPQERQRLEREQEALKQREREIRERNQASTPSPVTMRNLPPEDRALVQRARGASSAATTQRQITEARQQHFRANEYYVDADGTAYVATVNPRTGDIELKREEERRAQNNQPATRTRRTATIRTDRSRTDVAEIRNVPTGRPGETNQVRTETINTRANGTVRDSQIRVEQERRNADGSRERSRTEENYDGRNVATSRIQEQERTERNGDTRLDRLTTTFRADGTTPSRTVSLNEQRSGQRTTRRETTTDMRRDGTTPQRQVVVESGSDAEGVATPRTTAATNYDDAGEPRTTYIRRDGSLPGGTPPTEYLEWDGNGDVRRRLTGGGSVTEEGFEHFRRTGRTPAAEAAATGQIAALFSPTNEIREADPSAIPGAQDPRRWTRGSDNRFSSEALQGNLVEPLQASQTTPSVFDVPAALRSRASAAAIDQSAPATDPAAFQRLDREQRQLEQQLGRATGDAERERLMRAYFSRNDYWVDRGSGNGAEPVLMASAWSNGAPSSTMFGAARASQPHATMARTGVRGQDDMGQDATVDFVRNMYVDGSRDDIVRTRFDGPAGASRVTVTGEHTNAGGVVTEVDRNAQTMVARTQQGLPPLAVTEISRERFNERTGKPQGEQYYAVAQSDSRMTSLEEKRDYYGDNGVIYDTKIESTQMSRNYDAALTGDFLSANADVISRARDGDFKPNEHGTVVTVPPVGSSYVHSTTDIDYDSRGRAIFQQVDERSVSVAAVEDDDNGNGVRVNETETTRTTGTRGGTSPIFDEDGKRIADERVVSTITSTEYDPDKGTAGGNRSAGHQFREITSITMGRTVRADGTESGAWATPLTTKTLREGFDDDWVFDEKYLKTRSDGQLEMQGEGDERRPIELGKGDRVRDRNGNEVRLERDGVQREDLDVADKFEEFMEGWGGRIVGVAAIVAGIGGAVFTGGASLALTAVGVGLASASFAYTALNYSQGEASGWDLAIAGASVALVGLPAINGVRTLGQAGRVASIGRAGTSAVDDVVRGVADDALRGGAGAGGRSVASRGANAAGIGLDGYDGYEALRAAVLYRDFYGAGLMLLAIGGGAGAVRVRGRAGSAPSISSTPDASPVSGAGAADRSATPATAAGATAVNTPPTSGPTSTSHPLPGTSTTTAAGTATGALGAPANTSVAGARGDAAAPHVTIDVPAAERAGGRANSIISERLADSGFVDPLNEGRDYDHRERVAARLDQAGLPRERRVLLPDGGSERSGQVTSISQDGSSVLVQEYVDTTGDYRYLVYDTDALRAANVTRLATAGSAPLAGIEADLAAGSVVPGSQRALKPWSSGPSGEAVMRETIELPDGSTIDVVRKTANSGATQEHAAWELARALGLESYVPPTVRLPNGDSRSLFIDGTMTDEAMARRETTVLAAAEANVRSRMPELDDAAVTARAQSDLELLHYVDYVLGNHDHSAGDWKAFSRNTMVDADGSLRVIDFGASTFQRGSGVPAPSLSADARARLAEAAGSGRVTAALDRIAPLQNGALPATRAVEARIATGAFQGSVRVDLERFGGSSDSVRSAPAADRPTPRHGTPDNAPDIVDALRQGGQLDHQWGELVQVGRTADGRLFYLDEGMLSTPELPNGQRLGHIITRHEKDFANRGVAREELPEYLGDALTKGRIIGQSGDGREVYEFTWKDETHRVGITVSDRGFIVGANPVSRKAKLGSSRLQPLPEGHPLYQHFLEGTGQARAANALPTADARPAGAQAVRPDLLTGLVTLPGDRHAWNVAGSDGSGRIQLERTLNRRSRVDDLVSLNHDVVARLGGADAVRANPGLLTGELLTVRRSDGTVQPGWRAEGSHGGTVQLSRAERRSIDVGELEARRLQGADQARQGVEPHRGSAHAEATAPVPAPTTPARIDSHTGALVEGRFLGMDGDAYLFADPAGWQHRLEPAQLLAANADTVIRSGLPAGSEVGVVMGSIRQDGWRVDSFDGDRVVLSRDGRQLSVRASTVLRDNVETIVGGGTFPVQLRDGASRARVVGGSPMDPYTLDVEVEVDGSWQRRTWTRDDVLRSNAGAIMETAGVRPTSPQPSTLDRLADVGARAWEHIRTAPGVWHAAEGARMLATRVAGARARLEADPTLTNKASRYAIAPRRRMGATSARLEDIGQGALGDCYLHAAMASAAHSQPAAIRAMVRRRWFGVEVRVGDDTIRMSSRLPVTSDGSLAYGARGATGSRDAAPLWSGYVEKAYAIRAGGSYAGIAGGFANNSSSWMRQGGVPSRDEPRWRMSGSALTADDVRPGGEEVTVGLASRGQVSPRGLEILDQYGIAAGVDSRHAYVVQNVYSDEAGRTLVDLWNPWGTAHVTGLPLEDLQHVIKEVHRGVGIQGYSPRM